MSDILDGFGIGLLLAAVVVQFFVILFLYFGIPSIVMDILDEYVGGSKRSSGKRTTEGMAGLVQNPLIRTGIELFGGVKGNSNAPSTTAPATASGGSYLKGLMRR